jgi:hypothetical protein
MRLLRREQGRIVEEVSLEPQYLQPDPDIPGEHAFGAEQPASPFAGRVFDAINVSAPEPRVAIHLFGPLDQTIEILSIDATGAETIEVVVAFTLDNLQQPRRRFAR